MVQIGSRVHKFMNGIMVSQNTADKLCRHDSAKLKTIGFYLVTKTPHCTNFRLKNSCFAVQKDQEGLEKILELFPVKFMKMMKKKSSVCRNVNDSEQNFPDSLNFTWICTKG